jgi:hypothetical protein
MNFILDRLKEPSTWRGLTVLVGAFGMQMSPDLMPAIGTAVAGVIGLIEVLRKGP